MYKQKMWTSTMSNSHTPTLSYELLLRDKINSYWIGIKNKNYKDFETDISRKYTFLILRPERAKKVYLKW